MRDTQDCIDFCAKKGIQPDTELVELKLDDPDVEDDVNGYERGFLIRSIDVNLGSSGHEVWFSNHF